MRLAARLQLKARIISPCFIELLCILADDQVAAVGQLDAAGTDAVRLFSFRCAATALELNQPTKGRRSEMFPATRRPRRLATVIEKRQAETPRSGTVYLLRDANELQGRSRAAEGEVAHRIRARGVKLAAGGTVRRQVCSVRSQNK